MYTVLLSGFVRLIFTIAVSRSTSISTVKLRFALTVRLELSDEEPYPQAKNSADIG